MSNLCMNCMTPIENSDSICPNCKLSSDNPQPEPFLPKKYKLADRYITGRALSKNSESLNYIGYDLIKNSRVYIKEFFVDKYCTRDNSNNIKINNQENYNTLKNIFLKYYRSIAKLRNLSSIAAVYDILEQNNTCYIIIEWIDGTRFDDYVINKNGILKWEKAKIIFTSLLSCVSKMASSGVLHLGICPENIIITPDKKLKLTGFSTRELRTSGNLIESKLYNGCSALEQYTPGAHVSETTDVYGFAATLFFAISGEYPASAPERQKKDRLLINSELLKEIPENIISAIANALRIEPENRTMSFETLRLELSDSPILKVKNIYDTAEREFKIPTQNNNFEKNSNMNTWGVISCLSATLVLLVCFGVYWFWLKDKSIPSEQSSITNNNQNLSVSEEVNSVLDSNNSEETIEKIEVPQLIGKNLNKIQENQNLLYEIAVLSEEFHDSIPEGSIISQTPSYGEEMYKNSIIAVNISKGPEKKALPDISGKTLSDASLTLTDLGFIPVQINQNNSKFTQGTVINYQDYNPGDLVSCNSEVKILVSN